MGYADGFLPSGGGSGGSTVDLSGYQKSPRTKIYYRAGQTGNNRIAPISGTTWDTDNTFVVPWNTTPDEEYGDGDDYTVTFTDIADEDDADPNPSSAIPGSVFELPIGTFHLQIVLRGDQQFDTNNVVALRCIRSNGDDNLITENGGYGTTPIYHAEYDYLKLTTPLKHYVRGASWDSGELGIRGYLQITKV